MVQFAPGVVFTVRVAVAPRLMGLVSDTTLMASGPDRVVLVVVVGGWVVFVVVVVRWVVLVVVVARWVVLVEGGTRGCPFPAVTL